MNPPPTPAPLCAETVLDTAIRAARAAGAVQRACRREQLQVDRLYAHDVKLEADRLSEEAIFSILREADPDAAVLSEESGEIEGAGDRVWIVDPLDGTMNYFHGQHHYCTCMACYRRGNPASNGLPRLGEPVVGVVYAADYDELFVGVPGQPATLNGEPITISSVCDLADAIVTTSFGSKPEIMERMQRVIGHLLHSTRKLRIQGSCGLDICNVAAGRLSALYQSDVRCWDFSAARIVLECAGGRLEAEESHPGRWDVLATAPGVFELLRKIVHQP